MKLIRNRKTIILSIVIMVLLVAIGGIVYGIYSNNKQPTIAQPMFEEQENNNKIDTTRKYN